MIKNMNSKMTTNSQLSTEPKIKKTQKLRKQLEEEQNHRMEIRWRVISGEGWGGEMGEKLQGIRSINSRYKIDRGRFRIVYEM